MCPDCGHGIGFHIYSDGPIARPCVHPHCTCQSYEGEKK